MVGMSTFEQLHPRAVGGRFARKLDRGPRAGLEAAASAEVVEAQLDQPLNDAGARYAAVGYDYDPEELWDGVSVADQAMFTAEHCNLLADAVHARTGWPVVAVGDGGPEAVAGWCHAGVLTPAGLVLDVEGLHEPMDWVERWGEQMDVIGYDFDEYDDADVGVYDARRFGWAGPGNSFTTWDVPDQARARSEELATTLLDHPAVAPMR